MPTFQDLPVDLQNLCADFAWKTTWSLSESNIDTLLLIKSFKLPPLFFRQFLFRSDHGHYCVSPIDKYYPTWSFLEIFDIYRIKELLYNLDFRRRLVKRAGSRWFWMKAFEVHYENILQFGMFYKLLVASGENIWTPTYNAELANSCCRNYY